MADGNAAVGATRKAAAARTEENPGAEPTPAASRKKGPRKEKTLARQAEYFTKRISGLEKKLIDTKAKIPAKVLKLMAFIDELQQ